MRNMNLSSLGAACAVALCAAAGAARADDDGWVKLGEREVAFRAERDTIVVTAAEGRFNKLRFHVRGNGVELLDADVTFGNGEKQDLKVREELAEGATTRAIDLTGEARVIKRIDFAYKTKGRLRDGKATVAVWGKLDGGAAAGPAEKWTKLGQRQVGFGVDRDVIPVGIAEGLFKRIRLEVEGNEIELRSLTVRFGNGEKEELTVREKIRDGGQTRAIDLPGALRVIKEIELVYSTEGRPRDGRATVKAFGLELSAEERARAGGDGRDRPKAGDGRDKADDDQGWELLGRREVDVFGVDKDVIPVTAKEGRWKRIRLHVTGNSVDLLDLDITFGNGDKKDVQVRDTLREGSYSRAIDLPGEARVIRSVGITWKVARRQAGRGKATIAVWGKQD